MSKVALLGFVVGLACTYGCSGGNAPLTVPMAGASGSSAGTNGTGATGTAGATGTGGTAVGGDITKVVPTLGCGMDPTGLTPGMLVRQTIQTMGIKPADCADSQCGSWSYVREYYVQLPPGYVNTKAYPLLFEGPGCGGKGSNLYQLTNLSSSVIRVGVSPSADAQAFHAISPGQGCFDDHEGDDSVDWVFYENLYDKLAAQLCFDRHRVFASGYSSGAWLANELACKYAGDATRPIRGIMPVDGGLPTDPRYLPSCTKSPMAGMWVIHIDSGVGSFAASKVAIARAMNVNGCTIGTDYDTARFDTFPIGGNKPDNTCSKIMGCPDLFPLVVCPIPGNLQTDLQDVVIPGWATFLNLFSAPPLLTP